MTILVQQLKAEIERLQSQLEIAKKHGEVLQGIGRALSLPAGADLHKECVPAIYGLFQSIGRTTLQSDGQAREVRAIISQLQAENAELRRIVSECATACGAGVSPECSLAFMAGLPRDIELAMTKEQP